jgi:protein kinase C substrate 80K-H
LTPALPGFYCKNKGHRPSYISFLRVNDGICDYDACCDGSDEWAHVGGTKCEDKCREIGKEWRKKEGESQKSLSKALKKKKELIFDAVKLRKEVEDRIGDLEVEIKAQELKVQGLETAFEEIEREERGKTVKTPKKGKVALLAGLGKARVEELRSALIDVRSQRDESRTRVKELEDILSKLKAEHNPNFNDEGVKLAVRSWEEYAAGETAGDLSGDAARDGDLFEISKPDSASSGVDWERWENEKEKDEFSKYQKPEWVIHIQFLTMLVYKILAYLPPSLVRYLEDKLDSVKSFLIANSIISETDFDSSSESKAVTDARNALNSARESLGSTRKSLEDHRLDIGREYGPENVFRPLKGRCFTKDVGEYTYEHCFLEHTKQIPKKGGSSVMMGIFARISSMHVDEARSSGQIYSVEKTTIEYENGQMCWSGPARSTTVLLECGEDDEILKVVESEKCIYSMVMKTPAVCSDEDVNGNGNGNGSGNGSGRGSKRIIGKDEL